MPLTKAGTPLGASRRSPSPEVAAAAGRAIVASSTSASAPCRSTELNVNKNEAVPGELPPIHQSRVTNGVVHGLQAEVGIRQAEPEPVLGAVGLVGTLPVPDAHDLHPRPVRTHAVEGAHGVACLQAGCHPPEIGR